MAGRKRPGERDAETITATRELDAQDNPAETGARRTAGQGRPASGAKQGTGAKSRSSSGPARPAKPRSSTGKPLPDGSAGRSTGTVLEFPAPPRRRRRRIIWISTVSALLAVALFFVFLFYSPVLALKTVVVEGTSLLPRDQAEAALEPLKGQTLPTISDADVEALLKDRPEIEKIDVAADPPSTLVVTVTERVPVAVLQDGDQHVLIDEQGTRLAVAADRASVPLPLIDGGTEAVNAEVFPSITSVLAALPAEILAKLESASASTVDSVELKLASGQTVFWGSADANEAKAQVLEALMRMEPTDPPVQVYDVSTPDRPVTR